MVLDEHELIPFLQWLPWGTLHWLLVVVSLAVVAVLVGLLVSALEHGPLVAIGRTRRAIAAGIVDLMRLSPRRVWGLTRLAVK